jgi:hypothetical protein
MGRGRKRVRVGPQNQMQAGVHATFDDLDVGDVLLPANERNQKTKTQITDGSRTYFAPPENEDMVWNYIHEQEESRTTDSSLPPRPRVLETAPSQDQEYDTNYLGTYIKGGLGTANFNNSPNPLRSAIDSARATAPRTASSQVVTGVQWGPRPRPGYHTQPALSPVNWRQFNSENYRIIHDATGEAHTDLAQIIPSPREIERRQPKETKKPEVAGQLSFDGVNGVAFPKAKEENIGIG